MEKINIAELLKDCPIGMELDCTIYEDVILNKIDNSPEREYPIQIVTRKGYLLDLTKYGTYTDIEEAKCIIFPKGKTTWEGFQKPFKDGDILINGLEDGEYNPFIFKQTNGLGNAQCYCAINCFEELILNSDNWTPIKGCRLATEEEKQKLFQAIKDNGYVWNEETKSLEKLPKIKVNDRVKKKSIDDVDVVKIAKIIQSIHTFTNKFDITTLKPFESKVLVRNADHHNWCPAIFGCKLSAHTLYKYATMTENYYAQCVPYEGNEHLSGTTDDCDEYFKNW